MMTQCIKKKSWFYYFETNEEQSYGSDELNA